MRLFLLLVILLTSHYMGWGQHVIIKEDFEFLGLTRYDLITSDSWYLGYGACGCIGGQSRALHMNAYNNDLFTMSLLEETEYDSVYVEYTIYQGGSSSVTTGLQLQQSLNGVDWNNVTTGSSYNSSVFFVVETTEYSHLRLWSDGNSVIDNLLVIGYGNETSYDCNFDANQDGVIGAPDLMQFLAAYGTAPVCD